MDEVRNELYHHGILGMKWGQHRVAKLASKISNEKKTGKEDISEIKEIGKYHNKDTTKDIARSKQITSNNINKYTNKMNKIQSKMDKRTTKTTQNAIKKMSIGKALVRSYLMGSYGALVYTSVRAKGGTSKGKAATKAILNNMANNAVPLGLLSRNSRW